MCVKYNVICIWMMNYLEQYIEVTIYWCIEDTNLLVDTKKVSWRKVQFCFHSIMRLAAICCQSKWPTHNGNLCPCDSFTWLIKGNYCFYAMTGSGFYHSCYEVKAIITDTYVTERSVLHERDSRLINHTSVAHEPHYKMLRNVLKDNHQHWYILSEPD